MRTDKERIRMTVSGVTILGGEIVLNNKTLLVGPNGSGKTSVMNAVAMALSGVGLRGVSPETLAPPGKKPMVSLTIDGELAGEYPNGVGISDWKILDLANIGHSGPARSAFILDLLGGNLKHAELIEALVRARIEKTIMAAIRDMGDDVPTVVAGINTQKKTTDSGAKTNAARIAVKTSRAVGDIEEDLRKVVEELNSPETFAAKLQSQLASLVEKHPNVVKLDITKTVAMLTKNKETGEAKLEKLREEDRELSETMTRTKRVATLTNEECPLCGTLLPPEKLDTIREEYNTAVARRKKIADHVEQWRKYVVTATNNMLVVQEYDNLKRLVKDAPEIVVDIAVLRARQRELTQELASAEAIGRQGALDLIATEWRNAENTIKNAKTMKAEAATFPDQVTAIVKNVLGARDITFSKVGRTEDIVLVTETGPRVISSLSSGEFAIVAAAFAATDPNTVILVEAAEIDTDRLTKLMAHLKDMAQPVIMASWDSSRKAPGWTIKSFAAAE